jgi:hypothetical protein
MKESVIVCVLVITLIISNTPPVRAEPITLTVVAIAGVTAVALSAAADIGVHNETADPAIGEAGGRKDFNYRSGNEDRTGKNQKQDKPSVSQNMMLSPMPQ